MRLIKPRNIKDVATCVDIYISRITTDFMEYDRQHAIMQFNQCLNNQHFCRMLVTDEDEIVAWVLGCAGSRLYTPTRFFQLSFLGSKLEGIKAYRAVVILHEALVEEAIKRGFNTVASQCSPYDEKMVLVKILEKNGWERYGHTAIKKTGA